jgi:protoporphyrinogen/coproporphyrinogen III oxidase
MATRRVVVVGGGIAGLSAAYRIRETAKARGLDVHVLVLEAERHPGGKIATVREDGFLCETGPNGFLDNEPATLRLVKDLGLTATLQRSNDAARRRYLVKQGALVEMHMHPVKFLKSPLLTFGAKVRMAREYWVAPKRGDRDETVGEFGRRRLGKEFTEVMLDSMVSGIYAGDVDRLSVAAAFPKVVQLEAEHGGLFRGMLAKRKEVRARKAAAKALASEGDAPEARAPRKVEAGPGGVLHSFREGMGEPIAALARMLGARSVRAGAKVRKITDYGPRGGFRVHLHDGDAVDADAVVITVPANAASEILRGYADGASAALAEIPIAGVHVVCVGVRKEQLRNGADGFGALIPRREGVRTLGCIFSSSTFDGRAPEGHVLLTNMIGGRHDPAADGLDDRELLSQVLTDIRPLLGFEGEPVFTKVVRWARGIPQYEVGHLDRIARAHEDAARHRGLFLGGNSVAGVSFNHCIAHAETLGTEVCDFLQDAHTSPSREEKARS